MVADSRRVIGCELDRARHSFHPKTTESKS